MPTSVTYYSTPINIEYLLSQIRLNFGDLDGSVFTDTTVRTALINAIRYLQKKWSSKYQVFETAIIVSPQPPNVPAGYVLANTVDGQAYIPSGLTPGDVFRNPYLDFSVPQPVLLSDDETPIVLAATYLLRKARVSSSSEELVSWSTEDIRFTNLSKERSLQRLLEADIKALDDYFRKKLASPARLEYPIGYIPGLHDIYLSEITDTVLVSREL